MNGFTFDLQRFTTWLLTLNSDGVPTLTEEGTSNSTALTNKGTGTQKRYEFSEVITTGGDTVKLSEDITVDGTWFMMLKNLDMTLDLNGKTLKATGVSPSALITFSQSSKSNFTITDTSEAGNGALVKDSEATSVTNVMDATRATINITFKGGNLINNSAKGSGVSLATSSTFTMTGGTIQTSSTDTAIYAIQTSQKSNKVNISGGIIESGNFGLRIISGGTLDISGGKFTVGTLVNDSTKGTINITGGVFNQSDEALGILTAVTIDGETKYCVSLDTIGDEYIPMTIDGVTSYYSTQEKADAAKAKVITVTIDGEEKLFSSEETLSAAVAGKTKVTIDGATSYYTDAQDATTATADCAATVIVGDETTYFTTLAKAAKSVDGKTATINLLKNETGAGIMFSKAATNVTIDFGEHTYTVGNPAVGSQGTESQAFHFDKGATVTLKNGTITSSAESSSVAMLVQNYCNLTVEDMTLDGSNLADAYYGTYGNPDYLGACVTLSINNGTVNITGDTSIIAREDNGRSHYAMDVCASNSYPEGAHVTVDTTGTIGNVLVDGKKTDSDGKFVGDLTINGGTVGEIRVDSDAVGVNAQDKISITGGTLANGNLVNASGYLVLQSDPLFKVFADGYLLAVAGWNQTAAQTFAYVAAPESGNLGTKLITVSGIDSTDEIKFDAQQKVFAVPTTAIVDLAEGYKAVKVSYADDAATVTTTYNAVEITEKLLADTVTKISAAGNANTVYISGGQNVTSIVGGAKDDTLAGSNENLTLTGGNGADIFVYDSGELTITDYGTGSDKISVGADAGNPNVTFSGSDLVLDFGDGNTVNLLDAADKVVTLTNGTDTAYFMKDGQTSADGYSITLTASTTKYTAKASIKNVDGSKTSGVTITGNALDNVLTGGDGNDKFTGGKGDDIFVQGAGNDTITDYGTGSDKISVVAAPTNFAFRGSNLRLDFDNNKTLAFNGAKGKAITFTDGTDETVRTYFENGAFAQGGKVTINEDFKGSRHNISKANDLTQIDASQATVKVNLTGNDKGNTLTGGSGNDTLTGGKGDDLLTGNDGSDIFVYAGGADTVTDYKSDDTIKVNKGNTIQSAAFGTDVVFTFDDDENFLTLTGAGSDTITVKDASNKIWAYNKNFTAQGKGVTLASSATDFDATGTAFVTLDGSATSAVKLTGNEKNNVFVGTNGADTFIHKAGKDIIANYGDGDTVQVDSFGEITAVKFNATKTVLTVDKGAITFNDALTEINLVDAHNDSATLTKDGIVTEDGIQLFNGTKTYSGTASIVDATNVKNKLTLAGGAAAQTFAGTAGKTIFTFDGTNTMTISNYAAGDKISVNGSVTNFEVNEGDITLTVTNETNTGSIILQGAADKVITLHDDSDKAGKYTAHSYPQTGVTANSTTPTAVTLAANVGTYSAPPTVNKITYTGGNVTITNFDTSAGTIDYGNLTITDVTTKSLAFGTGNTLTIGDLANKAVQLAHTNDKGKTVNATVYLGSQMLTDAAGENVSVTSDKYTADDKIKTVAALGTQKSYLTGNALANTLTANNAGNTLDGSAGTDVLIGGTGADIFIHDKITGTTTINGYMSGDSINLGKELSIVGSAYSPSSKNGTLTLTVANNDNASTSKIVIKSDDFNDTDSPIYGTIVIDDTQTSFAKNATYADDKVKLLPTFSGTFNATASSQVDGSAVTKALTLNGTTGNETLTGGAHKTTFNGSAGDDSLIGGAGTDVFTYAAGDGKDVIAKFAYNTDKLQVSATELINNISQSGDKLTFTMTDGGSVTIEDMQTNILLKADNTLYWFDDGDLVTSKTKTADMTKIINDKTSNYAVVNLDYGTDLVTAGIAEATATTFNANDFKTT